MDLREIANNLEGLMELARVDIQENGGTELEETVRALQGMVGDAIRANEKGEWGCHVRVVHDKQKSWSIRQDGDLNECVLDGGCDGDCYFAGMAKEHGGRHMCPYWQKKGPGWVNG
jgi:hypothetical protein